MCKFISIGVERQENSVTIDEATRNYARSCECCANKGYNFGYDCDDCPITVAHREKLETIITLRQLEHEMAIRNAIRKELGDIAKMVEGVYARTYCPEKLDEHNEELDELTERWLRLRGERYV